MLCHSKKSIRTPYLALAALGPFLVLSVSCLTTYRDDSTDNKKAFRINCTREMPSKKIEKCHEKARDLCPEGYTTIPVHTPEGPLTREPEIRIICN